MTLKSLTNIFRKKNLEAALYEDEEGSSLKSRPIKTYPLKPEIFAVGNAWINAITANMDYVVNNVTPNMESNPLVRPFLEQAGSAGFFYAAGAETPLLIGAGLLPIPNKIKSIGMK